MIEVGLERMVCVRAQSGKNGKSMGNVSHQEHIRTGGLSKSV